MRGMLNEEWKKMEDNLDSCRYTCYLGMLPQTNQSLAFIILSEDQPSKPLTSSVVVWYGFIILNLKGTDIFEICLRFECWIHIFITIQKEH